mgnify:CR=1 FL=1
MHSPESLRTLLAPHVRPPLDEAELVDLAGRLAWLDACARTLHALPLDDCEPAIEFRLREEQG